MVFSSFDEPLFWQKMKPVQKHSGHPTCDTNCGRNQWFFVFLPTALHAVIRSNGDTTMYLARLVPRAIGRRFASKAPLTSCLATFIMAQKRPE